MVREIPLTHGKVTVVDDCDYEALAQHKWSAVRADSRRSLWYAVRTGPAGCGFVWMCIKAGCPAGGLVLDPFGGAGTVGLVANRLGLDCTLIELNPEYAAMAERRIHSDAPLFADVAATAPLLDAAE